MATRTRIPVRQQHSRPAGVGVLLLLLIVVGLLNFPIMCACGAMVPHEHSLFQVDHHHHGGAGGASGGEQAPALGSPVPGVPVLEAPTGTPAGSLLAVLLPSLAIGVVRWRQGQAHLSRLLAPSGRTVAPEPPPPQFSPSSL